MLLYEQWITLFFGIVVALLNALLFVAVYGMGLESDKMDWFESTDVSVSKSMALLGQDSPAISVVVIYSAIIVTLISLRQNLLFPILPILYGIGASCFALLPIITTDVSLMAHAAITVLFFVFFLSSIVLATKEYKKYEKVVPLVLMCIIDTLTIIGILSAVISVIYGVLMEQEAKFTTVWFTITEFLLGFAVIVFMIIISLPDGDFRDPASERGKKDSNTPRTRTTLRGRRRVAVGALGSTRHG